MFHIYNICRQDYVFWVNSVDNSINRGSGIEIPSPNFVELVNSSIGCSGEMFQI